MKKTIFIIIGLLLSITISSCKDKDQTNLKILYENNMQLAYEHYDTFLEFDTCHYVTKDEFVDLYGVGIYNNLSSALGGFMTGMIYTTVDGQLSDILAVEYENETHSNSTALTNPTTRDIYFAYKNCAFVEMYPSYILIYGTYLEENNILYAGNQEVLLHNKETEITTFNENTKTIAGYACNYNKNLKTINTNNVETIGHSAFYDCYFLEKVTLNDQIKFIDSRAFYNCTRLDYIVIPSSVTYIGELAFSHTDIFLETESIPSTFDKKFTTDLSKVYTKDMWKYNSEGIPELIKVK